MLYWCVLVDGSSPHTQRSFFFPVRCCCYLWRKLISLCDRALKFNRRWHTRRAAVRTKLITQSGHNHKPKPNANSAYSPRIVVHSLFIIPPCKSKSSIEQSLTQIVRKKFPMPLSPGFELSFLSGVNDPWLVSMLVRVKCILVELRLFPQHFHEIDWKSTYHNYTFQIMLLHLASSWWEFVHNPWQCVPNPCFKQRSRIEPSAL